MNSTNLRPEAGGNPAKSNATDLKNEPKAPQDDNDFPDAPDESDDDRPQDKPDLDAFAKRMGTDTIESGEGLDAVPEKRSAQPSGDVDDTSDTKKQRMIIGGAGATLAGVMVLVVRRRRRNRSLLAKAAALGAAAHIIRD